VIKEMGLIVKELEIKGDLGERKASVLFDTGASVSFIRRDIVEDVATRIKLPTSMKFKMGDGETFLEAKECCNIWISVNGCTIWDDVVVVDKLSEEMIIGAKTLQGWRIKLDLENDKVIIDKKVTEMKLV